MRINNRRETPLLKRNLPDHSATRSSDAIWHAENANSVMVSSHARPSRHSTVKSSNLVAERHAAVVKSTPSSIIEHRATRNARNRTTDLQDDLVVRQEPELVQDALRKFFGVMLCDAWILFPSPSLVKEETLRNHSSEISVGTDNNSCQHRYAKNNEGHSTIQKVEVFHIW